MIIKQISVFVENKKGRLSEITDTLAKNDINIRALSIADTTDFGILRLIVDNADYTEKVLKEAGVTVSITNVVALKLQDKPGSLSKALLLLAENSIDVEYIYAFISKSENEAFVVLKINDEAKAVEILKNAGYEGYRSENV